VALPGIALIAWSKALSAAAISFFTSSPTLSASFAAAALALATSLRCAERSFSVTVLLVAIVFSFATSDWTAAELAQYAALASAVAGAQAVIDIASPRPARPRTNERIRGIG